METLQTVWFALTALLLTIFLIAGGIDFGAGILSLFSDADSAARKVEKILPFWDGNQVWLITAVGALFAAFPKAYSAILSSTYTVVIALVLILSMRVFSIEMIVSSKTAGARNRWVRIFGWSSLSAFSLIGLLLGAISCGTVLPFPEGDSQSIFRIFTLQSIASGIMAAAFAAFQASLFFLHISSNRRIRRRKQHTKNAFVALSAALALYVFAAVIEFPVFEQAYGKNVFIFALLLCLCSLPLFAINKILADFHEPSAAMIFSSLFAMSLVAAHAFVAYPNIIPSGADGAGMKIFDAGSSRTALTIMSAAACLGIPLVAVYNIFSYKTALRETKETKRGKTG